MKMPSSIHTACRQAGQSMVEYTVVLVFGVMVLTTGPGGDVILQLTDVIKNKYQGYSYSVSLSYPPVYDSLGEYLLNETDAINPNDIVSELQQFTSFPTLPDFDDVMSQAGVSFPNSPADVLDGVGSFF